MTRGLLLLVVVVVTAQPVTAQERLHGADSVLATSDVVIVWAILRAPDEHDTQVIVRVVPTARFGALSVDAVDPFSGRRQQVTSRRALTGEVDIRRHRADFADLPRLEIHLHASDATGAPGVTVFYLGVPDTTPEFDEEPALRRYLAELSARARGAR